MFFPFSFLWKSKLNSGRKKISTSGWRNNQSSDSSNFYLFIKEFIFLKERILQTNDAHDFLYSPSNETLCNCFVKDFTKKDVTEAAILKQLRDKKNCVDTKILESRTFQKTFNCRRNDKKQKRWNFLNFYLSCRFSTAAILKQFHIRGNLMRGSF